MSPVTGVSVSALSKSSAVWPPFSTMPAMTDPMLPLPRMLTFVMTSPCLQPRFWLSLQVTLPHISCSDNLRPTHCEHGLRVADEGRAGGLGAAGRGARAPARGARHATAPRREADQL